jgi:hypothetical protein
MFRRLFVRQFRRHLCLSGMGGLLVCGLLATISTWLLASGTLTPPLPHQAVTLLVVIVFGCFSIAEIPMMIFAMRRLAAEQPENRGVVLGLNVLYVSFAAVYGVPVLLLTGSVGWGLALCGLGLVRFVTSLAFVREGLP